MKACIIQPPYSQNLSDADQFFEWKIDQIEKCDRSVDIIVLPEYSDVPVATKDMPETLELHNRYMPRLMEACAAAAKRCSAHVFVNALSLEETGWRNTTYCLDKTGEVVGKYFKKHLPPLEKDVLGLDSDYTMRPSEPYVLELDGIRYGFLTCYDFYFYEAFARIAREKVDVIIGCSLQRSDSHDAIETMCRFLAYNTNAYVLRSSVSFDEASTVCGASMAVSPEGKVLCNLKGRFGAEVVEFDPAKKYLKPAGFGNPDAPHHEYIEYGRMPWQYRPAGPAMIRGDKELPYPRVCSHRGFNTIAPENSMPAFGAAIAMGAEEIEFDLWPTLDGEIVSCHDATLDRVSTGSGKIYEKTLAELLEYDFGVKYSERFAGLKVVRFEDILQKFARQVIMNVHVKPTGPNYDPGHMKTIVDLVRKYDAQKHVYFMIEVDEDIKLFKEYAPEIAVCVGHDFNRNWAIVDRAIALGAEKVQFFKPYYNAEMIAKAKEHGIICNIFWSEEPEEAANFVKMGMDTVLTNDYNLISNAIPR
ncbi:MAG: hypothetical protein IKU11_12355 [Clostridia bacterium]|nr:hypothetical protein [Clostridia bacterium]